jgi:hypothetical protein
MLLLLNLEQYIIVYIIIKVLNYRSEVESFILQLPCTLLIHSISTGDDMAAVKVNAGFYSKK